MAPWRVLGIALACAALALGGSPTRADEDEPPPPPPPNPDPTGTPGTTIDDRSYTGLALSASGAARALGYTDDAEYNLPAKRLFTPSFYTRISERSPIYAPALMYSDNLLGLDLAGQWFFGGTEGYGIGARLDLSRSRRPLTRSLRFLYANKEKLTEAMLSDAMDEFIDAALSFRYGVVAGYQNFDGGTTRFDGEVINGGVTASKLWPLGQTGQGLLVPGLLTTVTAQALAVRSDPRFSDRTVGRVSVVLAYQDQVPEKIQVSERPAAFNRAKEPPYHRVARWKYRAGVEYINKTSFDTVHPYNGFLILRTEPKSFFKRRAGSDRLAARTLGDLYSDIIEFKITLGRDGGNNRYGSLQVGYSFR